MKYNTYNAQNNNVEFNEISQREDLYNYNPGQWRLSR